MKMAVVVGVSFKSRIDHWGEPNTFQGTYILQYISDNQDHTKTMLKLILIDFPFSRLVGSGRLMVLKRLLYKDSKINLR